MRNETTKGPGAFLTAADIRDAMMQQGRPILGSQRIYGSEYDGYFIDRRWLPVEEGAPEPASIGFTTPQDMARIGALGLPGPALLKLAKKIGPKAAVRAFAKVRAQNEIKARLRALRGLGAAAEPPFDYMAAVKEMYGTMKSVSPFLEFIGNNPIMTVTIFMLAIGIGSALGGYIGAGGGEILKKRKA